MSWIAGACPKRRTKQPDRAEEIRNRGTNGMSYMVQKILREHPCHCQYANAVRKTGIGIIRAHRRDIRGCSLRLSELGHQTKRAMLPTLMPGLQPTRAFEARFQRHTRRSP